MPSRNSVPTSEPALSEVERGSVEAFRSLGSVRVLPKRTSDWMLAVNSVRRVIVL